MGHAQDDGGRGSMKGSQASGIEEALRSIAYSSESPTQPIEELLGSPTGGVVVHPRHVDSKNLLRWTAGDDVHDGSMSDE